MNDLHGPPYTRVLDSNGALPYPEGTSIPTTGSPRRALRMMKRPGEGSFGMTLEQHSEATADDYPRVSYVFPNSAAWRAGVRSGWTIESINGVGCRGRLVREVASMFRDLQEVTMSIYVRTETVASAPMPSLGGNLHLSASSAIAPPQQRGPVGPSTTSMQPTPSTAGMTPALPSPAASVTTATTHRTQQPPPVTHAAPFQPTTTVTPVTTSHPARLTSNGTAVHQSTATAPPSAPSASAASPSTTVPTLVVAPRPSTAHPAVSTVASSAPPPPVSSAAITAAPGPPPSSVVAAAAAHTATVATHTATEPTRAAGKKRARSQSDQHVALAARERTAAAAAAAPEPTIGKKRGRSQKRRQSAPTPAVMDISEASDVDYSAFVYCSEEDDADVEEVAPPPTSSRRTSSRQAESGGRVRRSLTISRLMDMGFKQEDAELSVQACGQDPDKCMLWLVTYREEQQFMNDLNQASIESENQRRLDAEQQNRQELETLRQATAFASLFPTSYILSDVANAPRLREMLSSTIGEIAADTLMRTLVTKLLTVESKAIRWYKGACKCYMLQLAARLEAAFASHDAVACCATLMATQPASAACAFVQALHEEEQALTQALFFMPENQGGVPLEFLRADESMQFTLDDDGFEVVDQPPPSASSPGRD